MKNKLRYLPNLELIGMMFCLFCLSGLYGQVTIGTGTNSQRQPFSPYFGYERSASLYTSAEIGTTGTITTLGWYVGTGQSTTVPSKIYLKTTTATTLTAGTWATLISGATLVYDASRTYTPSGWLAIDITDYIYFGDNLLVLCETNYGSDGNATYATFRYTTSTSRHEYWYQDNSAPTGNGSVNSQRPNIQVTFGSSCTQPTSQATIGAFTNNTTGNSITANWTRGTGDSVLVVARLTATSVVSPISGVNYSANPIFGSGSVTGTGNYVVYKGTGLSVDVTSLASLTGYTFDVYEYNNTGVCYKTPASSLGFTTICTVVTSLPWSENFDGVTTPAFPSCWYKQSGDWVTTTNSSSSYDADARSGTQFLRESWNATNEYVWTPGFLLTAGTAYDFSFWWAGDTYSGWTGDVFYNSSQSSTGATQLGTSFVSSGTTTSTTYAYAVRSFTPSTSGIYYFAVKVNEPVGSPWFLSFDDFKVEAGQTCFEPTHVVSSAITANSATILWNEASPAPSNGYQYEVRTTGAAGSGPTGLTSSGVTSQNVDSVIVTGLSPNTIYYVYVRSNCGAGGYSPWTSSVSFLTLLPPCSISAINFNGSSVAPTFSNGYYYFDVCKNSTLTLGASATCSSCSAINYTWVINAYNGSGPVTYNDDVLSYPISLATGYDGVLYVNDGVACNSSYPFRIRSSQGPTVAPITASISGCAGNFATIAVGSVGSTIEVAPHEGSFSTALGLSDTTFIPDGPDCNPSNPCYESSVTFTDFPIGSTVESVEDLLFLRINFEHSFIGDLEIKLICPDSKSVTILPKYGTYNQFSSSGPNYPPSIPPSSSYTSYNITPGFGVPIFTDNGCLSENNTAGIGWNYCWSSNTTLGYQFAGGNIYSAENSNSGLDNDVASTYVFIADSSDMQAMTNLYVPYESFSLLEGCPLNGEWKIQVCDTWAVDNGWIFEWELSLDPDILPATWSYSVAVDSVEWSLGASATTELVTDSPLVYKLKPAPGLASGNYNGTFTVNDEYGCGTDGLISYSVEGVPAIAGIQTGDFIWTGFLNNSWIDGAVDNWMVKTGSGYDYSNVVPDANSNVFIIDYCSNNNPVIMNDLSCKDVTINADKTLTMTNRVFEVAGNWTNLGTFEADSGTVVFNGGATQAIDAGGDGFYNLVVQKPSGLLSLSSDLTVNNQLSMLNGNVVTNGNVLALGTGIANRGSLSYSNGHIRGKLKRWFAASTNTATEGFFPMGNGTLYRPTEIEYKSAPSSGGSLTVMFNENPMGWQNSNLIPPISALGSCPSFLVTTFSNQGFWQVDPADGLTGGIYDITLYANGMSGVSNLCKLTALKRVGGGNWTTSGTHVEPIGTIENPIVKRTGASGWSNWGVGGSADNPLLVSLLSYSLSCMSTGVVIDWSTASEVNNNFFSIERSDDGVRFEKVAKIGAVGNCNTISNYQYVDIGAQTDNSYYKLSQTDFDGTVTMLGIKAISCNNAIKVYSIIPNPFNDKITIQGLTEEFVPIEIFDFSGTMVYSDKVNSITGENLNLSTLASGIYWVRLLDVDGVVHQFKIIKN